MTPSLPQTGQAPPDSAEGQLLGSYQLLRLLGEGSMGRVFQARHARLGREVALKVLRGDHARNSALVVRFFEEARTVNRIQHPHIVQVFDFVEDLDSGQVFFVMEMLEGQSLAARLRQGPLSLELVLHLARQLASALAAAHAVGVVHRDLKPDNIHLVERAGQLPEVKVLDFGVAKLLHGPRAVATLEGTLVGTPLYMAPEQAAGLETDERADIYAVGNLLYEMLAGRPPFEEDAFGQLLVRIITEAAPSLPERTAGGERVPAAVRALVGRCLEKRPEARPPRMDEVLAVLEGRKVRPAAPARPYSLPRAIAGATGLVGTAAAALLAVRAALPPPPAPRVAVATLPSPALPAPQPWLPEGLLQAEPPPFVLLSPEPPPPAHAASAVAGAQGGVQHAVVRLRVSSEPAGALVTVASTGEALGHTPLVHTLPREAGPLVLRLSRAGHLPAHRRVTLASGEARLHVPLRVAPHNVAQARPTQQSRDDVLDPFAAP